MSSWHNLHRDNLFRDTHKTNKCWSLDAIHRALSILIWFICDRSFPQESTVLSSNIVVFHKDTYEICLAVFNGMSVTWLQNKIGKMFCIPLLSKWNPDCSNQTDRKYFSESEQVL